MSPSHEGVDRNHSGHPAGECRLHVALSRGRGSKRYCVEVSGGVPRQVALSRGRGSKP